MKINFKVLTISLLIVLISIGVFVGVYQKKSNMWENLIPDFKYGMDLDGNVELRYIVDTTEEEKNVYIDSEGNILGEVKETETEDQGISLDTTVDEQNQVEDEVVAVPESEKVQYATEVRTIKRNPDENVNIENFEKTKKIIQKRIEKKENFEYNIRQDTVTGELVIEVPNRESDVSYVRGVVETVGEFQIIDDQTGIILMDNDDVKRFSVLSNSTESGYQIYLNVEFNKEGIEKIKKISNEYIATVDEGGNSTTKYVSILLDGSTLRTTYFGEEVTMLQFPLGQAVTTQEDYVQLVEEANSIINVLQSGKLPIVYALNNDNYVQSSITKNDINICKVVFAIVIAIISVYLIIRFKVKGIFGAILSVGYIAVYILAIKYTNVTITINAVIAFVCMIIINYIFMISYLLKLKNDEDASGSFLNLMKRFYLNILPICIVAVIFTFVGNVIINSIGMILFWGLLVHALYNFIFTRTLYILK